MPRWRPIDPDGGSYVLLSDRALPAEEQVVFTFRCAAPSEIASLEQSAGHVEMVDATIRGGRRRRKGGADGETEVSGGRHVWISNAQTTAIRALLLLLTDVAGTGPDGRPLRWPADGDDKAKERFLALFSQPDLYEVAEAVTQGGRLSEDERGNSVPPPS